MTGRDPLDGVRIVSLAGQYPGPYATLLLADLGADIIFVERPDGGDPVRSFTSFFATVNRDKSSVVVDLKSSRGQDELLSLIATADVLIDGFRPGVLDRLGMGSLRLRETNPRLVIVSATGYGHTGPLAMRSGHDLTYRAEAGMLMLDGATDRSSLPIADVLGAHGIVESVLLGLLTRHTTDPALDFDVSIFDTLISTLSIYLEPIWNGSERGGFPAEPGYGTFTTADHRVIALGVAHEDKFWQALCVVLGMTDVKQLSRDERFARHGELRRRISEAVGSFEALALEERLLAYDVPFGQARELGEIATHPQVVARGLTGTIQDNDRTYVRQPLVIDGERPAKGRRVAPRLGEDDMEFLPDRRFAQGKEEHLQQDELGWRSRDNSGQAVETSDVQGLRGGFHD